MIISAPWEGDDDLLDIEEIELSESRRTRSRDGDIWWSVDLGELCWSSEVDESESRCIIFCFFILPLECFSEMFILFPEDDRDVIFWDDFLEIFKESLKNIRRSLRSGNDEKMRGAVVIRHSSFVSRYIKHRIQDLSDFDRLDSFEILSRLTESEKDTSRESGDDTIREPGDRIRLMEKYRDGEHPSSDSDRDRDMRSLREDEIRLFSSEDLDGLKDSFDDPIGYEQGLQRNISSQLLTRDWEKWDRILTSYALLHATSFSDEEKSTSMSGIAPLSCRRGVGSEAEQIPQSNEWSDMSSCPTTDEGDFFIGIEIWEDGMGKRLHF